MISKQYIKNLEFRTLEEFFTYVIESKINGNYKQTKRFVQRMNEKQFLTFLNYSEQYEEVNKNDFITMRFERWANTKHKHKSF